MSRPHTNTAEYFLHTADASNGKTVSLLEKRYGNDGYAVWFKMLELLTRSENHFLDLRKESSLEYFCNLCHLNKSKAIEILSYIAELEGIDPFVWGAGLVWSQNLVDGLKRLYHDRKREIPQKPEFTEEKILPGNYGELPQVGGVKVLNILKGLKGLKKPLTGRNLDDDFDRFWSLYPRKVKKPAALRAFTKVNPQNGLLEKILEAIKTQSTTEQWLKDGGKYIPHPSTWLNNGQWDDQTGVDMDKIAEDAWAKKMELRKEQENARG